MDTSALRQQLHQFLEVAGDNEIKALYAIVEQDFKTIDTDYSDELKQVLDDRYKSYKNGNAQLISADESKKRIQQLLNIDKS